MKHRHKAIASKSETWGFTGCVRPGRCNPAAHGNVVHLDRCSCGATRSTNVNCNHVEIGQWQEPEPPGSEHDDELRAEHRYTETLGQQQDRERNR
jgi:hypothetical protein